MLVDLIGGQIQLTFAHITSILPYITAGRVRALATTAATRLPALPEVPTTAEAGFAGVNKTELWGIIGPARMPQAAVKRLNSEIAEILKAPALYDRLTREGAQVVTTSPEKFSEYVKVEVPKIAEVLTRAGIKPGNF